LINFKFSLLVEWLKSVRVLYGLSHCAHDLDIRVNEGDFCFCSVSTYLIESVPVVGEHSQKA